MTWLIVGGSGQLGSALSTVLVERGISYKSWGSKDLDIRSIFMCRKMISELLPTVIVNSAAWTDVDGAESDSEGAYAVNFIGASNLVEAAKGIGAVFVHISTDYVFSGKSDFPWREDDTQTPLSVYGASKAAGERAVLSHYLERTYLIRTAWLYSRWGKNFAKTMAQLAISTQDQIRVVNNQVGQPTSALDLANQIIDTVIKKLPFGTYHGTNAGEASWFDFASSIFELAGSSPSRLVAVDSTEFSRPAPRPAYSVLGHNTWNLTGTEGVSVPSMRNWKIALEDEFPALIAAVKAGE